MVPNDLKKVEGAAAGKLARFQRDNGGFFLSATLAGMYIAFGAFLAFKILALGGSPMLAALSFSVALSLVIHAGGTELFTGNVFVQSAGYMKSQKLTDVLLSLALAYVGNLVGSLLTTMLFMQTQIFTGMEAVVASSVVTKTTLAPVSLIIRGILCNILVCLAVYCSIKMETEAGKQLMIFLCVYAFFTLGFEHSIANMTTMAMDLFSSEPHITWAGYGYNLFFVTLGNILGGWVFLALPYRRIQKSYGEVRNE